MSPYHSSEHHSHGPPPGAQLGFCAGGGGLGHLCVSRVALFRGLHLGHPCSCHLGMTSCSRSLCIWHNFKGVFISVQVKKAEHSSSGRACLLGAGAGISGGGFHQRADQFYTQNTVPCLGRVASWPACSKARVRPGLGTAACTEGHSAACAEHFRGKALLSTAAQGAARPIQPLRRRPAGPGVTLQGCGERRLPPFAPGQVLYFTPHTVMYLSDVEVT